MLMEGSCVSTAVLCPHLIFLCLKSLSDQLPEEPGMPELCSSSLCCFSLLWGRWIFPGVLLRGCCLYLRCADLFWLWQGKAESSLGEHYLFCCWHLGSSPWQVLLGVTPSIESSSNPVKQWGGRHWTFPGPSVGCGKINAWIWQSLSTGITCWLSNSVFGKQSSYRCLSFIWENPCERNMEILILVSIKKAFCTDLVQDIKLWP